MDSRANGNKGRSGSYGYRASSGYGYGYNNTAYGYGTSGYGATSNGTIAERNFQDYALLLRERSWYIALAFIFVVGATAFYTFTRTPLYLSAATVEIFRRSPSAMQLQQVLENNISSAEDLNTQLNILKSQAIIAGVFDKMTASDRQEFLEAYPTVSGAKPSIGSILARNREILPERLSLIVAVTYKHPKPEIAAKIANLFADSYIDYNAKVRVDQSMKAVEELRQHAEDQRKRVDEIAASIQAYREKNHLVSLDQRKDIVTETLKELNTFVTQSAATLQSAEIRWNQVQEKIKSGGELLDLPFIATVPAVSQLQSQVATQKIGVAQLGQRYRPRHPVMIQAQRSLDEARSELLRAIRTSTAQIESDYKVALSNYAKAQAARTAQETQSLSLDRYGLEYSNLERDYEVNEKVLEQILDTQRLRQSAATGTEIIENQNARIVDRARPASKPIFPDTPINMALGAAAGLALGLGLAFMVAYLDDRIKSAFDIETVIGLPLIGIIPEIKKMRTAEAMDNAVAQGDDHEITEAFSTLMSVLQLKEESKSAQCLLITSTIAGEGKSFIASNLAKTFASHGERVVLIDCDLRRPAINRVFHMENLKGVIDVCTANVPLEEAIAKNIRPNLDIVLTGGRSKNPTQTLNSKEFALMISELRKRYTKIIVDTPPIAIVSDAMIIMPLVDGSIYSIYFNKAKRKTAQYCAQRLLETNVPCFGAVLNGLTGGLGGYYYSHYYDRSYKDYYVKRAEAEGGPGSKISETGKSKRRL
jgi:succinoglycan biosynthesis transport protein ExoP